MRNESLYLYLTGICKNRNLPIEGLPKLFGYSRSSIYRYMTGIVRMSPEVQAKFTRILRLEDEEKQELERLLCLSEFDSSMIAARYALDDFVFGKNAKAAAPKQFKFAYHESDTFLRTWDEIYSLIQSLVLQSGATCTIRMINCLGKDIFCSVKSFIEQLFSISERVMVKHFLASSEKDHLQNITTFMNIIPLLKYENYSVYSSTKFDFHTTNEFFSNTLIIDISLSGAQAQYFYISFFNDDVSACLATIDKHVFAFLLSNYKHFKRIYDASILETATIDIFSNSLLELQQQSDHYLLKPNFCYDDIPMSVYQSLQTRGAEQDCSEVLRGIAGSTGDPAACWETILSMVEQRIAATHANRRINVHSMDALRELAKTGQLSDHYTFMPTFNKQELRAIFEQARERNRDPKDSYTLCVTREKILENGHSLVAFKSIGILIEYNQGACKKGIRRNIFIRSSLLADIVSDYVLNHLPGNHALSQEETTVFLSGLIASLE